MEAAARSAGGFRVLFITGPRQRGKTTLSQTAFPDKPHVSLEAADERAFALEDPRGFLGRFPDGGIIDEAQWVPELFSYVQVLVDEDPRPGRSILTASQNFGLRAKITQSPAIDCAIAQSTAKAWLSVLEASYVAHLLQPPPGHSPTSWTNP